jgi:ribonuclease P protein component
MGEASVPAQQPQASPPSRLSTPDVDPGGTSHPCRPPPEGTPPAVRLIAPVKGRRAFAAFSGGRRVRTGTITVTWVPGDPSQPPRVAYAVGRRAGGAVVRNRIRRRLRAVIRELSSELVPGAYLIGAGAQAASLSYRELRATVSEALRAVVR